MTARFPHAARNPWAPTLIATAAALCAHAAGAQQAPAKDETVLPAVRVTAKPETVVTADTATLGPLGELPLTQTPFSINVITRELIDKQQAAFLGDLLKNDPSATVGNVAVPFLLLRGFPVGGDGLLYDGMTGHGGFTDGRPGMQMIDQVEVLKGASAFLYGVGTATSLGGTVNYMPKRPTNGPVRDVELTAANRSLFGAAVDLGDRFGEGGQFGYRLNVGYRDGEQAVDRYGWTQRTAALALDWRAQPGLLFNVGLDYVYNANPELPPFFLVAPGVDVPGAPDTRRSAALSWDRHATESRNAYGRMDWNFSTDWSLTAQLMRNLSNRPDVQEARFGMILNDAGDVMLFSSRDVSSNNATSAQALLHGKVTTGSLRHALTFGAASSRQTSGGGSTPYDDPGTPGPDVFFTNIYNPVDYAKPEVAAPVSTLGSRTSSDSVLASDIVDFAPQWSALLGLRYAKLKSENTGSPVEEVSKTLPTAALMWKPMTGALVYVNYAEGLEQGGATDPLGITPGVLPPRHTKQVELGGKLEHNGVLYTAAVFDMRRPMEGPDPDASPTSPRNIQRGTQRHQGVELLVNGNLLPQLTLVGGVMLLDSKISGTGDGVSDGNHAIGVPELSANLWGEYRFSSLPGFALNAGVYHSSKQYLDAANTQTMPGWTRWDAGVSYETRLMGTRTEWLLTIENLADKDYWASAQSGILTMGDPRTYKLAARFRF